MGKGVARSTVGCFTRKELAAAFDAHMQTITKWEQEGMPVEQRGTRGRPSLYRLSVCIAWRIERELKARGAGDTSSKLSPHEQRAALDAKRTEELDLKIRVRKEELIEVAEAERDLANVATATKARVRRIPAAVAEKVVAVAIREGSAAVRALLLAEIDDALRELAAHGDTVEDAA